jgi:hypothetical protein
MNKSRLESAGKNNKQNMNTFICKHRYNNDRKLRGLVLTNRKITDVILTSSHERKLKRRLIFPNFLISLKI